MHARPFPRTPAQWCSNAWKAVVCGALFTFGTVASAADWAHAEARFSNFSLVVTDLTPDDSFAAGYQLLPGVGHSFASVRRNAPTTSFARTEYACCSLLTPVTVPSDDWVNAALDGNGVGVTTARIDEPWNANSRIGWPVASEVPTPVMQLNPYSALTISVDAEIFGFDTGEVDGLNTLAHAYVGLSLGSSYDTTEWQVNWLSLETTRDGVAESFDSFERLALTFANDTDLSVTVWTGVGVDARVEAIPEPHTWSLMLGGLLLLGGAQRMRTARTRPAAAH